MSQAIAAILSPAVGIAISPFPIVGLILILLSDKARVNSLFYTVGWIVGNGLVFFIALFALGAVNTSGGPSTTMRVIFGILAVLLIGLAIKDFVGRPKKGEPVKTPGWFKTITAAKPVAATGFGFLLSALNPKNLLLDIAAGAGVSAVAGLAVGDQVLAGVIFLVIACCSIYIPMIAFLIAGDRLNHVLNETREWLVEHNAVVMSVLFLLIGISLLSKAIG